MPSVLIVDDKEENRYVLKNFFRLFGLNSGIELLEASSGDEAVKMVGARRPNLVLMDIKMESDYAGLEATKIIKSYKDTKNIVVWALTAQAMEAHDNEQSDRQKCLEAGCDEYITKPFDQVALLKKIALLLGVAIPEKTRARMGIS